jgi:glycosyltransferase involved in cell wall biosynthesis
MRILYISPGLVPPPADPRRIMLFHAPPALSGDVLWPTWAREPREITEALGPGSYPEHRIGRFTNHLLLAGRYPYSSMRLKLACLWFYLRKGWQLSRKSGYDCILTYGWTLTGITGLLLARVTGSKLIVTIPGIPENAYRFNRFGASFDGPEESLATRAMRRVSDFMLHFVLRRADCAHLYYPEQLQQYPKLAKVPRFVTHGFTPVSLIPANGSSDGSVLLIGAPWYVKGVDILIKAFRMIESEFPDAKLRVLGYFPGEDFKEYIGDSRQIEILKARSHPEAMEILANCSICAIASRTDAKPRVMFEAMAAGKPLVAPRVGGIPYYVQDGVNGLLFEREDLAGLAGQLRKLLSSPELCARLGKKGQELVREQYDEAEFGRKLQEMVELVVRGAVAEHCGATAAPRVGGRT